MLTRYPPAIGPKRACAWLTVAGAFHLDTAPTVTVSVMSFACIGARAVELTSPELVDGMVQAVSYIIRHW